MLGHDSCRLSAAARYFRATASASGARSRLQQQIHQHLRRIGADRLRVGLLGLLAEIVQSLLDVVAGQDRQIDADGAILILEGRIARIDEAAGQVLAVLAQLARQLQLGARRQVHAHLHDARQVRQVDVIAIVAEQPIASGDQLTNDPRVSAVQASAGGLPSWRSISAVSRSRSSAYRARTSA